MIVMSNTGSPDPLSAILDRLNGTVVKVTKLRQSLDNLETELTEIRQLCENEIRTRAVTKSSSTAVTVAMAARIPSGPVSTSTVSHSLNTAVLYHPPRQPTDPFPFPEKIELSSYPSELKREGDGWFALSNPSPKIKPILDIHLVQEIEHDLGMRCVRFSHDGKWLAVGSWEAAHIYDVNTGVKICVLDHADGYVWSICFSPDGKYLVTAFSKQIRIWDIIEKQIHSIFEGHQDFVSCLHFSPNGQLIVSGSHDGSVRIWDVDGRPVKTLTIDDHYSLEKSHKILSVAISPDGSYVAVGCNDMVVRMFDVTTGVLVQKLRGHRGGVASVAFAPDGKGLISGSLDTTLKSWNISGLDIGSGASAALISPSVVSSSPCLMNLTGHKYDVRSIAVSYDGTWVVSTTGDGDVLFWDMRTGIAQCMVSGHLGVNHFDLSPTGNLLAMGASLDTRVRIWSYGPS